MGLIVLMIDGVSADTFARDRGRMPHLASLAERGTEVVALGAEVPGTSLPGRASILTGVTSDVGGVYGNMVWSGERFRYATPDDVRVPTLVRRATEAGRRTASVGMGLVRPEDATVFARPWWVGAFVQRARDAEPTPAEAAWLRVVEHHDPLGTLAAAAELAGVPADYDPPLEDASARSLAGFLADQRVGQWVGAIATAPNAPELIVAESLMTDAIQHRAGYRSDLALWSMSVADAWVGDILARLRAGGVEDRYDVVVLSDHGHGPIDRALRPDVLLPGLRFQSEGGMLHLAPRDAGEAQRARDVLSEHGVVPYDSAHVPADVRDAILTFLAPDGVSFEHDAGAPADAPVMAPKNRSSHGARPGHPSDDRFLVMAGPSIGRGRIERAEAHDVAPTLAALAGLPLDPYAGSPLVAIATA